MTYPAHHDLSMHDIPDRSGDPLVTGEQAVVDMLVRVAYNAWRQMGSTQNAAPCAQALSDRIIHPRPGDLVYVPDSFRRGDDDTRRKGVGYLVVERVEWWHSDENWLTAADEEGCTAFDAWTYGEPLVWDPLTHPKRPKEKIFYVQYGPDPGDICRWENATCYAIPYGDEMMHEVDEAARKIIRARDRVPVRD